MRALVGKPKAAQKVGSSEAGRTDRPGSQLRADRNSISPLQPMMEKSSDVEGRTGAMTSMASPRLTRDFSRISIHPPTAGVIQAKSARASDSGRATTPVIHNVLRSSGRPLEPATRAFFESRLRHDFTSVRVHTDGEAARAAQAIDSRAYTSGQDIVFGRGEYRPGSAEGRRLLAHELTHVVQQRRGVSVQGGMGRVGDVYERHADRVADAVVTGRSASELLGPARGGARRGVGSVIQKQEKPAETVSAPEEKTEEPAETDGDKMRKAILASAEGRYGDKTTIVSEDEIKDIQEGRPRLKDVTHDDGTTTKEMVQTATPVKNFTTCIEFAGQSFIDAAKAAAKAEGLDRRGRSTRRACSPASSRFSTRSSASARRLMPSVMR